MKLLLLACCVLVLCGQDTSSVATIDNLPDCAGTATGGLVSPCKSRWTAFQQLYKAPSDSNVVREDKYVQALKAEIAALRAANEANKNLAETYREALCATVAALKPKTMPTYCGSKLKP